MRFIKKAIFGLFILIKGIKPSIEWLNKTTDKELVKGIGLIAAIITILFYIFVMLNYLINFKILTTFCSDVKYLQTLFSLILLL